MQPRHLIAAFTLAFMCYPLSLGPVVWWMTRHHDVRFEAPLETFYGPLGWAMDHSQTVNAIVTAYLKPWEYRPPSSFHY